MIFVTVGTQLPFDRLIKTVDAWAAEQECSDVFAQTGPIQWQPDYIEWTPFVDAEAFRQYVTEADIIVAHAGMGSIITALELAKPIVVMPRRAELGEHRNDHQIATARRFLAQGRIEVAFCEDELKEKLSHLGSIQPKEPIGSEADPKLISALNAFIKYGEIPSKE